MVFFLQNKKKIQSKKKPTLYNEKTTHLVKLVNTADSKSAPLKVIGSNPIVSKYNSYKENLFLSFVFAFFYFVKKNQKYKVKKDLLCKK